MPCFAHWQLLPEINGHPINLGAKASYSRQVFMGRNSFTWRGFFFWKWLLTRTLPVNNSLLTGTVLINNYLLTRTVLVNNSLLTRKVPVNIFLLTGILKGYSSPIGNLSYEFSLTLVSPKYPPTKLIGNCQLANNLNF